MQNYQDELTYHLGYGVKVLLRPPEPHCMNRSLNLRLWQKLDTDDYPLWCCVLWFWCWKGKRFWKIVISHKTFTSLTLAVYKVRLQRLEDKFTKDLNLSIFHPCLPFTTKFMWFCEIKLCTLSMYSNNN